MTKTKKPPLKPHGLLAVIEKAPETNSFFFMDINNRTITDFTNSPEQRTAISSGLTVFFNAKQFLKSFRFAPSPDLRLICLSTIKKIIKRDHHETLVSPDFTSAEEALSWCEQALKSALTRIEKREQNAVSSLECQVIPAVVAMEEKGLPFNKIKWQTALDGLEKELSAIKDKLGQMLTKNDGFQLFGPEPIDLNNLRLVKDSLEQILGRKLLSTSQSNLKDIDHEACKNLVLYREHARMIATYGETFLSKIKADRIFGNFIPIGSASGRFACHDPNLLALPNHPLFQACIKPKPPYQMLYFDYGGFELRILASLSKDKELGQIFNDGLDIHSMVAEAVFHQEVSKSKNTHLRDQAKLLNFGIIYGMGEQSLAHQLKISLDEARLLLHNYFTRFYGVRDYLASLEVSAKQLGYSKTALGRRAYFSTDNPDNGYNTRFARNFPIQGTGADIVKLALCKVFRRLHDEGLDAHVVNLVHDELVIECHSDHVELTCALIKNEMELAFNTILPDITADISIER